VDEPQRPARRSALPWPSPVRPPPGRWTVLVSAALMLAVGLAAVAVVVIWL
jgi:hypothetical protein